ncbi:MAG TPA: MDR family MFS transporter [Stellaceae bacterium]|jgi:EmrB/QacA subfamily drug resistance transporter|nr:MDR family MFS transporter [Stellaceae bacterium]
MADQTPTRLPQFSKREILSILFGLMLAMFLASLDQTVVATSLSTMANDLNGWALMSWVVSAYLVASTVTTPIYGRLSDIYGRRVILLIAIGLFVGASVLCALSQTMPQLIAARVLQGIGGGGLRSVAQAAIADVIAPRERGKYQGYFSSVMAVSNVLGPVLGGFFADYLSWHWIFWINIPFGMLAIALVNRNLRRLPKISRRAHIDWLGAVLIIGAATPLLLAMSNVEGAGGWLRWQVLLPLGIGVVFLGLLLVWERETRSPMIPLRLFGNRIFTVAGIISFTMSMVMIALIILVPLAFELVGGLSPDRAGARLIPMTGGTVLGSFIAGQLVTRTGRYRIYPIMGAGAMTLACVAIALVGLGRSIILDTAMTAVLGLSFGFQLSPVIVPVQNALALEDTGIGLATNMFFRLMGGAFGVALLSAVLMAELNAGALQVPGHEVLGAQPGLALFHMELGGKVAPGLLAAMSAAMRTAFAHVFLYAGLISAVTFGAALALKEIPLRGSAPAEPPRPREPLATAAEPPRAAVPATAAPAETSSFPPRA